MPTVLSTDYLAYKSANLTTVYTEYSSAFVAAIPSAYFIQAKPTVVVATIYAAYQSTIYYADIQTYNRS